MEHNCARNLCSQAIWANAASKARVQNINISCSNSMHEMCIFCHIVQYLKIIFSLTRKVFSIWPLHSLRKDWKEHEGCDKRLFASTSHSNKILFSYHPNIETSLLVLSEWHFRMELEIPPTPQLCTSSYLFLLAWWPVLILVTGVQVQDSRSSGVADLKAKSDCFKFPKLNLDFPLIWFYSPTFSFRKTMHKLVPQGWSNPRKLLKF